MQETNVKLTFETNQGYICKVMGTSNEKIITVNESGNVKIWDLKGNCLKEIDIDFTCDEIYSKIDITPNGQNIIYISNERLVKIYNLEDDNLKILNEYCDTLTLTPDGEHIMLGSEGMIEIFDFDGNLLEKKDYLMYGNDDTEDDDHTITKIVATQAQDDAFLVAASGSMRITSLVFNSKTFKFDDNSGTDTFMTDPLDYVYANDIISTQRGIVCGFDGDTSLRDWYGNIEKKEMPTGLYVMTPNEKYLITGSNTIEIGLLSGEYNGYLPLKEIQVNKYITAITITQNSNNIISAHTDGTIIIWNDIDLILNNNKFKNLTVNETKQPICGIQKINNQLIIYYKNGNVLFFDKNGNLKEKIRFCSEQPWTIQGLTKPKINFYPLLEGYIVEKDGFYFGSKNWKNFVTAINEKHVDSKKRKYKSVFDSITNKNLLKEI